MQGRLSRPRGRRRSSLPAGMARIRGALQHRDRDFISLIAMRARARILLGRRGRYVLCNCSGGFDGAGRIGVEWQSRLQFGGHPTAAAGAIILKSGRDFTAPFRLDGQVSFCGSDNSARNRRAPEDAQRGVAKTANIGRIAIHGAAMLTGFYHRSVLRCGCLAERKSGVVHILPAERACEHICVNLSRNGYPRQPRAHPSQSMLQAGIVVSL